MISFPTDDFKVDIEEYNLLTLDYNPKELDCPYCHQYKMVRHGYYPRYIIEDENKLTINILRLKCKDCKHTHALLPSFIIPYQHHPIEEQHETVSHPERIHFKDWMEYDYKSLRKLIQQWKAILAAFKLSFSTPLHQLIKTCSDQIQLCYLQMHKGRYFLKEIHHITCHSLFYSSGLQ